jgi:hypothetical protein
MVSSTGNILPNTAAASFTLNKTISVKSTDSFTQQLISALDSVLGDSLNSSNLKIDIRSTQSQVSGGRQYIVTVKNADPATTPLSAASATAVSSPASNTARADGITQPYDNPTDAYWAMQPPEVQALRDISDDTQRAEAASELAYKGFAIDVPIMVWKWDPLVTMELRKSAGYTWVPSAMQAPVQVAPGLAFPGSPSYDPNNPPPGSIKVTTDFATGTLHQDPMMKDWVES